MSTTQMSEALKRHKGVSIFRKAHVQLMIKHPFFSCVLGGLQVYPDFSVPTACTDGQCIRYNPDMVVKWGDVGTMAVIVHELYHVILLHPFRLNGREHQKSNKAMDYAINLMVQDAGFVLPSGCLLDEKYRGHSWERIYGMLPDSPAQQPQQGNGQPNGGGKPDPSNIGGVDPYPSASPADTQVAEEKAKINIAKAYAVTKSCGSTPGHMAGIIDEIMEPKVDWRDILSRFIEVAYQGRSDFSWSRPNPRYIQQGVYMPSLRGHQIKVPVFAGDSSGSMVGMLGQVASEMFSVLATLADGRQSNVTLPCLWCDTRVYRQDLEDGDKPKVEGGGGTDFAPVFDYYLGHIEELGDPPCIIYVTDGCCGSFGKNPGIPVLWVLTCKNRNFKPPFGEVTYMEE